MNLKAQLKAALKRAAEIGTAAKGRDFSDEELTEIDGLKSTIADLREKIAKSDEAAAALKSIADSGDSEDEDPEIEEDEQNATPEQKSGGATTRPRNEKSASGSLGEAWVKSAAYKAFQKENPSGVGQGTPIRIDRVKVGGLDNIGRKALLGAPLANLQPVRLPTIDQIDRPRLTLLDLITRGQTAGAFEYLQVIAVTRNAAIVAETTQATIAGTTPAAGLKPISDLTTNLADAKVYTYADGYDVTNQLLSDAPAIASYMNAELQYSLPNLIEDKLLKGTGASGEPRGILNTTGVQNQAFDTDMVTSIRKGITRVTRLGGQVTAVLMSPEDDEEFDLLQDANGRYYGGGPFQSGPGTVWGRPRVVSERLEPGQVILGDFATVALLDREGLSITAFNQHKDYAQRNLTYVRAELRAAQAIFKPSRLVIVDTAAG